MKSIKKGIAALLAAALIMPNLPAAAAEVSDVENVRETGSETTEETNETIAAAQPTTTEESVPTKATTTEAVETEAETAEAESEKTEAADETQTAETQTVTEPTTAETVETEASEITTEAVTETETTEEAVKTSADTITFNTGNGVCALSDSSFGENGSYTIDIPEINPFFPYEVQFTYDGKTKNEWFMTPDDKVTIDGYDFYVDADFDNTVVTQMSLNVAGQTVVVYPKEKTFQDNGIADAYSLLPLEEKSLEVDLTGFTPVELTMVSVGSVFAGENELQNKEAIVWTQQGDDNYMINQFGDVIDLSYGTYSGTYSKWEMIAGIADQLEEKNVRYQVTINYTKSREWLLSEVYVQSDEGARTNAKVTNDYYDDQWGDYNHNFIERRKYLYASSGDLSETSKAYVSMKVNDSVFNSVKYDSMRAFEGKYANPSEITEDKDITDKLFCKDMTVKDAGYLADVKNEIWITFVTYDSLGNPTGCMPFNLKVYLKSESNYLSRDPLFCQTEYGIEYVSDSDTSSTEDGYPLCTYSLYKEYPANDKYTQRLYYYKGGENSDNLVTAAYAGKYQSISEAVAASAKDIKADLFGNGYTANYSQTICFSIFVGADDDEKQEVYHWAFKTVAGEKSKYLSRGSLFYQTESGTEDISYKCINSTEDGCQLYTYSLYKEYPIDGSYTQRLYYSIDSENSDNLVTAAYVGKYESISEAVAASAKDIKADLFGNGYTANYSQTVYFSIFVGADNAEKQEVYHWAFKTVAGEISKNEPPEPSEPSEPSLSSATLVTFTGLKDDQGNEVTSYVAGHDLDSYGEYSYLTIFVEKDTDVTKLAPLFEMSDSK
ncbi:MAG: hypothetical protein K2P35_05965, partial [Lachnospiraceae bacterium]|nr:hypothetical protein [Lachnospiraceae bacterium]